MKRLMGWDIEYAAEAFTHLTELEPSVDGADYELDGHPQSHLDLFWSVLGAIPDGYDALNMWKALKETPSNVDGDSLSLPGRMRIFNQLLAAVRTKTGSARHVERLYHIARQHPLATERFSDTVRRLIETYAATSGTFAEIGQLETVFQHACALQRSHPEQLPLFERTARQLGTLPEIKRAMKLLHSASADEDSLAEQEACLQRLLDATRELGHPDSTAAVKAYAIVVRHPIHHLSVAENVNHMVDFIRATDRDDPSKPDVQQLELNAKLARKTYETLAKLVVGNDTGALTTDQVSQLLTQAIAQGSSLDSVVQLIRSSQPTAASTSSGSRVDVQGNQIMIGNLRIPRRMQ